MQIRIGNGYDVHRFAEPAGDAAPAAGGTAVTIGGVSIAHDRSLMAHSDGDVLVHAVCDAILGALALGDIGQHFPDTDPRYRGVSSLELLSAVMSLGTQRGWHVINVDTTLVAEAPKFAPHTRAMRSVLAARMQLDMDCVSVKATTTERLGFTGRGEGIACYAVVLLGKS